MKKIFPLFSIVMAAVAFYIGCSDDSSSSSANEEPEKGGLHGHHSSLTKEDSSTVVVYTYEEFSKGDEVKIIDGDTTEISIDKEFAGKADSIIPKPGNVLVIWNDIMNEPFYLRVTSFADEDSVYTLTVDKASPFEALPEGDYELSSEIYVNPNAVPNGGGKLSYDAFYNKEKKVYHPFLIKDESKLLQSNSELLTGKDLSEKAPLSKTLKEKRYVDLRDVKLQSGSVDWTVIDIDKEFNPGVIAIPGLGKTIGDYQGSWLDSFGGIKKLEKAMDDNDEKNPDGSPIKAYVRMDTLKFKSKANFHLSWTTSWLSIKGFDFYVDATDDIYVSNIGFGLGAGFSGEKKLSDFEGKGFTFSIFGIPVYIKIVPNFYLKYSMEAYAVMDYKIKYAKHSTSRVGLAWKGGSDVSVIKDGKTEFTYNEFHNFKEFINNSHIAFCGKASAGLYFRMAALFYNVVGPTAGIGFRIDLDSRAGASTSYDENGKWTGEVEVADDSYIKLDGALAVEAGAEVSILGHTLFSKAYDVYDIMPIPFFHLPDDEKKPSEEGSSTSGEGTIPTSSSIKPWLSSSSNRYDPGKPVVNPCSTDNPPSYCSN